MSKTDSDGRSALHRLFVEPPAAGHADRVRRLVAAGADVNLQDRNGWSPLHFAAAERSAEGARALLDAGATPDLCDNHGNGPLFRAIFASQGDGALIKLLVDAGADPDAPNAAGISPRMLADRIGGFDALRYLPPPTDPD